MRAQDAFPYGSIDGKPFDNRPAEKPVIAATADHPAIYREGKRLVAGVIREAQNRLMYRAQDDASVADEEARLP